MVSVEILVASVVFLMVAVVIVGVSLSVIVAFGGGVGRGKISISCSYCLTFFLTFPLSYLSFEIAFITVVSKLIFFFCYFLLTGLLRELGRRLTSVDLSFAPSSDSLIVSVCVCP